MTLRKALVFSWCIPPAPTGSAVIMANLAQQFTAQEMTLVGARFPGSPPVRWLKDWPRLVYTSVQPPYAWRGGRYLRWAQFPWTLLRGLMMAPRHEVILGVFPDERYLLAAYLVSVIARKPLYLYFHNTFTELRTDSLLATWLQRRVFERARHVFVMSQGMERLYRERYPGLKCSPLTHAFNGPSPDPAAPPNLPPVSSPLRLAMSGNVNKSNIGAARRFAEAIQRLPDAHLTLYSQTDRAYLKQQGFDGARFTITTVSPDVLTQELRQADLLLLPHGFTDAMSDEEIQTIFPTRTIEYLLSGRPIIAHLPAESFLTEFLRKHDCAVMVTEPDTDALCRTILDLAGDPSRRAHLVGQALRAAQQFHAPRVAEQFRVFLR